MTDPDELVEVENVRYRYRSARAPALQDVSLRVERGVVLGLVGPNGSGKTTLYRLVLGFISPHGGRVRIGSLAPQAYRTRRGIGYLPEQVRLPGNVRVYELARLIGRLAGLERVELNDSLERSMSVLALDGQADAMVGTLSHGYRQRVGLLAAMLGDPELLLFDEPANGLDPASVGILRSVLRDLKRRGRTAGSEHERRARRSTRRMGRPAGAGNGVAVGARCPAAGIRRRAARGGRDRVR
jgi:ABC-type multidrug transport system ATPase subunit